MSLPQPPSAPPPSSWPPSSPMFTPRPSFVAPHPRLDLQPLGPLPTVAKTMVIVTLTVTAFLTPLNVFLAQQLSELDSASEISPRLQDVYDLSDVVTLLWFLVLVGAAIASMALHKRMADNGAKIMPAVATQSSHWVITGWFVPFLNFVKPYQMMKQIWTTSRSADAASPTLNADEKPPWIGLWWGLIVSAAIVNTVAPSAPFEGGTPRQLSDENAGLAVMQLVLMAAGIVYLVMMRAVVDRHNGALENPWDAATSLPAPPPIGAHTVGAPPPPAAQPIHTPAPPPGSFNHLAGSAPGAPLQQPLAQPPMPVPPSPPRQPVSGGAHQFP